MKRKRSSSSGGIFGSWIGCLSPLFRIVAEAFGESAAIADRPTPLPVPICSITSTTKEPKAKRRKTSPSIESDPIEPLNRDIINTETQTLNEVDKPTAPSESLATHHDILYHELHADEFDPLGWLFIRKLPPRPTPPFGYALPPLSSPQPPITVVLDLDETLVHCSIDPLPNPDYIFSVSLDGIRYKVYCKKRPHLEVFLKSVCEQFEVVLFTASQEVYAKKVLKRIDPSYALKHRRFRDACTYVEGSYVKDLTILERPLSRCVLVDNSPQAFGYQLDNGILIKSWEGDSKDEELLKIDSILKSLASTEDVRPILRDKFAYYKHVY